jgi:DHA2 family multidrug resistance protein-like MFS transporter
VLAAAPPDWAGAAAAIPETGADLGGSLGVAVLGSIGIAVYRASIFLPSHISTEASGAARDTLGGAMDIAAGMGPELGDQLRRSAQSAFTSGFAAAMGAGAILLLAAAALFAWTAFRGRAAQRIPRSEEA